MPHQSLPGPGLLSKERPQEPRLTVPGNSVSLDSCRTQGQRVHRLGRYAPVILLNPAVLVMEHCNFALQRGMPIRHESSARADYILPFVHTARYYRLNGSVRPSDRSEGLATIPRRIQS